MSSPDTPASQPAPEPAPLTHPPLRVAAFLFVAALLALSQSLGQGFLMANSRAIAGEIGASQTQSIWLMVAYMAPRASLPILLIKIRTQYGLRRFAVVGIIAYSVATVLSLFVTDLHSAIATELISGIAAAPLSSLAFLYMLEPLPQKYRLSVGLCGALTLIMLGMPLARVLSQPLLDLGGWEAMKLFDLGLILIALPFILLLPLSHAPRHKVLHRQDFLAWGGIALGFGGIVTVALWGTTLWWANTAWLGMVLAGSICALTFAAVLELHRDTPLMDIRWIATPRILHLSAVLLLFRMLLAEQSAGAPGLLQTLSYGTAQMAPLFGWVVVASLAGGLVCGLLIRPDRVPMIHAAALLMIAAGAWMDSTATALTGPDQMRLSQGLIAFGGAIFMPSAMTLGLMAALQKGPEYILSFVMIFLSTQSLGGVIGSGLFRTGVALRTAHHAAILRDELMAGSPAVTSALSGLARQAASLTADPAGQSAQAASRLAGQLQVQAQVLAYNDLFRLTALLALAACAALALHLSWGRLTAALAPSPSAPRSA